MTTRTTAVAAATGLALGLLGPLAAATEAQALPAVMITRVQYDSPGADTRSNASLNGEYVVLKNTTRSNRSLTGWTLRDRSGHVYRFPSFTLKAGASVTVRTGTGAATAANRYFGLSAYVWNNTGDTAYLRSAGGSLADSCAWSSLGRGSVSC